MNMQKILIMIINKIKDKAENIKLYLNIFFNKNI